MEFSKHTTFMTPSEWGLFLDEWKREERRIHNIWKVWDAKDDDSQDVMSDPELSLLELFARLDAILFLDEHLFLAPPKAKKFDYLVRTRRNLALQSRVLIREIWDAHDMLKHWNGSNDWKGTVNYMLWKLERAPYNKLEFVENTVRELQNVDYTWNASMCDSE